MRFLVLFALYSLTSAFCPRLHTAAPQRSTSLAAVTEEFDHLLRESNDWRQQKHPRRQIRTNDQTVLVSSVAAPVEEVLTSEEQGEGTVEEAQTYDPYSSDALGLEKIRTMEQMQQQQQPTSMLKKMDLQDIIATLIIPSILVFVAGRWGFNRVNTRVQASSEAAIQAFVKEMLYHDGNYDEMKLCIKDYQKRLAWMPNKRDVLLKNYLESYAKTKTVSPAAISSLSQVFAIFKLSEEAAAQTLTSLCREMGASKIASAGKLLFLGSRILQSPEGQRGLEPIKELIKSTYREVSVAEEMVENSQQAIAEASYRSVVLKAGKQQKSLTPGWKVLGLDQAVAERIFSEEANEGFLSDREAMYGGQTTKYDKKGRAINADGSLKDPSEADDDEDEDDEGPPGGVVSNVYECGNCGYTLFVAKGREEKFFGSGFRCPECGAAKKEFFVPDLDE